MQTVRVQRAIFPNYSNLAKLRTRCLESARACVAFSAVKSPAARLGLANNNTCSQHVHVATRTCTCTCTAQSCTYTCNFVTRNTVKCRVQIVTRRPCEELKLLTFYATYVILLHQKKKFCHAPLFSSNKPTI